MRKIIQLLVIAIITAISFPTQVKASHFAGADLTYTCLGGTTYLITLSFYKDCGGISSPTDADIVFSCTSNPNIGFTSTAYKIAGTGQEITPGCSAVPTSCSSNGGVNGSGPYGIQEFVYQTTVQLPPCNHWEMHWTGGARNPITTVSSGGNWWVPARLNNYQAFGNSSPTFSNKPIAVVCNNQSFCFNHGAVDPDGDSLVYSFYAPYTTGLGVSITYNVPYSASNFLNSSTPITLDPVTGDICFTPTTVLNTVTGIKVEEWRKINGVPTHIGTVYRDIQLKVTPCSNIIPILSGMDTLLTATYKSSDTTYYLEKCLSTDTIKFHINGFDLDTFDASVVGNPEIFHIDWNHGINGASFTSHYNGTDSAYAEFEWLPTIADVSTVPKCFTATIHDEACPYYGSQTFSYCLVIRGMLVDIGSDTLLCEGESILVSAASDTTTVNYLWYMDGNPISIPPTQDSVMVNSSSLGAGIHTLSIETNDGSTTMVCPGRDDKIINVVYQPNINNTFPDTAFCYPTNYSFDAGPGQTYKWTDQNNGGVLPIGATQMYSDSISRILIVNVDGGQNTRCFDIDTFEVVSLPTPKLDEDTCVWFDGSTYELDAGYVNPGSIYKWSTGDDSRIINVSESGNYSISISHSTINPGFSCVDSQVVNIIDNDQFILSIPYMAAEDKPMPGEDWKAGSQEVCTYQRVRMKGPMPPNGHNYAYVWTKDGNVVSNTSFFFFKETNEGVFTVGLNAGGCEDEVEITAMNCDVEVPNIITPNGDGSNDNFKIVLKGTTKDFYESFPNSQILIFNRWGKKIYESNNYQNDWSGEDLSDGVYYWTLKLADGKETEMNGSVTIMRK